MLNYAAGQDTITYPMSVRIGADLLGPASYFADRNSLAIEGFISMDRDTSKAYVIEGGYLNFSYTQYNYDFNCRGGFIKLGMDFNLLSPFVSKGKYFAGIGLRYGMSIFNTEVPVYEYENYWGSFSSFIPA